MGNNTDRDYLYNEMGYAHLKLNLLFPINLCT